MPLREEAHRARGPLMSCGMFQELDSVLMLASRPLRTSLPERPWMTRFAFTSGTCVAAEQPVMETVSFDVLRNDDTRGHACQSQQCACPISIHMPLALMN